MGYDLDETACDRCGAPTPRMTPPAEFEICEACYSAESRLADEQALAEIRRKKQNEALFLTYVRSERWAQ